MGEKEQGLEATREAGSGMASGRVFPETNVAPTDPDGGGIAIGEEGVQVTDEDAGGGPSALASNLNSSRSNIYRTAGGGPEASDEASEAPIPGKPSKEQRMQADLETAGSATVSAEPEEGRISTNVTIEEPKQKHFGE